MRGESHLTTSIMISLPTAMALFLLFHDTMDSAIFCVIGGIMFGCLLPDVDASDAKVMHGSWEPIGLFGKYIFYKPMTWILRTRSDDYRDKHRGYLHSLFGCFLATIFFAIPIALLFVVSTYFWSIPIESSILVWFAWIGLPFGFLMHLIEDSFTKSGVRWRFPHGKTYSSSTSTGKKSEYNLVTAFLISYGLLTIIVFLLPVSISVVFVAIIWSMIIVYVLYALNPIISKL